MDVITEAGLNSGGEVAGEQSSNTLMSSSLLSDEKNLEPSSYHWSVESIKTAFKNLAKTDFKIMKLLETSHQQLCEFFLELLVHRPNNNELTPEYVWIMITAFCEINWPNFIEIRKQTNCTAYKFLRSCASFEQQSTGVDGIVAREMVSLTAGADGKMTQPLLKVVGRFKELKRGYDSLVADCRITSAFPIKHWISSNLQEFPKYVPK